jgi:hypothetical protein
MRRRELVATATLTFAGCLGRGKSGEERSENDESIRITDWHDGTSDAGVPFSAAYVEANTTDVYAAGFVGEFDDGSTADGATPGYPEDYGDIGNDLLHVEDSRGWVLFFPDVEEVRLVKVSLSEKSGSWER